MLCHGFAAPVCGWRFASPEQARRLPPDLLFPVRCEIGRDCWFFGYMDLDSGPAYRDYRCGLRLYEGHKGTDIAVDPGARLPVIAAADGVVLGRRDGMEDSPMRGPKPGKQEMQQWRSPGPWRRLDDPILPSATRQRYGAQG